MKLPKIFGRKNQDEDDEDFDEEDFDIAELDDEDLDEDGDAVIMSGDDDHEDSDYDDDDEMIGEDDEIDDPFEDDDDIDFDDDEDDEEEAAASKRKALLFAALGAGVVLLSALSGAGWWYFSSPAERVATPENAPGSVEMAMPAAPGSLNAQEPSESLNSLTIQDGAAPSTTEDTASNATSAAPAATPAAPQAAPQAAPAPSLNSLNSLNSLGTSSAGGGVVVPAVANSAVARIPDQPSAADQSQALSNAPVKALLEEKDGIGELPKIGPNQVASWQVYARPVDPGLTGPMIGLMIEGIGLSRQASLAAINKLPPEVSMVLSPYGRELNDWVFRARLAGHEVFMSLPMESEDFPMEDAGPLALDTRIQLVENYKRMDTVMAQAGGYVGLVSFMGSKFMKAEGQVRKILEVMKSRGLMFVVGGNRTRNDAAPLAQELVMAFAESDMYIDDVPRIQQIRTNLDKLESLASDRGAVLAMARPNPVTIKSILDWIETLKDKDVKLVPASKIAKIPGTEQ